MDPKLLSRENIKYFDSSNGFGKYKPVAIELLRKTVEVLEEFNINYFLISGTLLGYIRHNDFIPWDDDIDLIVDKSILEKLPLIYQKYHSNFIFIKKENYLIKLCSRNGINVNNKDIDIGRYLLNRMDSYRWPFIDLFIYDHNPKMHYLKFFNKQWNDQGFLPGKKVDFLGFKVNIPSVPEYFLRLNFGHDYMTTFRSNSYNHRQEIENGSVKEIKTKN